VWKFCTARTSAGRHAISLARLADLGSDLMAAFQS
jgi:hypothetical protein